jgi:hypothetical protein
MKLEIQLEHGRGQWQGETHSDRLGETQTFSDSVDRHLRV